MKERRRGKPMWISILIILLCISTVIGAIGWQTERNKNDALNVRLAEQSYTEGNLWKRIAEQRQENVKLKAQVDKQGKVIAEIERIKGIAVSSVTYYAPTGDTTKTGTVPDSSRTVAVDPSVIPLGSDVYIDGIGWRKAEDTGSAIDGTDIDVFVDSEDVAKRGGRVDRYIIWREANQ